MVHKKIIFFNKRNLFYIPFLESITFMMLMATNCIDDVKKVYEETTSTP